MSSMAWLIKYEDINLMKDDIDWIAENFEFRMAAESGESIYSMMREDLDETTPRRVREIFDKTKEEVVDIAISW